MTEVTLIMGKEHDLDRVNDALRDHVRSLGMVTVGALHVTCSDEAEYECMSSFQDRFVRHLLPDLKLFRRTAMHSANLGGRYERSPIGGLLWYPLAAKGSDSSSDTERAQIP